MKELILPTAIKEKLLSLIKPIEEELIIWLTHHHYLLSLSNPAYVPASFIFNHQLTIDCEATASMLIQDESLCIPSGYRIAAVYCKEQQVRELWDQMEEAEKDTFLSIETPTRCSLDSVVFL